MVSDQQIKLEDLYGTQKEIAELIGIENYIKLSLYFGGDNIYVQKYSEVIKVQRNSDIRKRFNGSNSEQLAKEYNLSERYIRMLCCDIMERVRSRPIEGQLSMFDTIE